MPTAARLNILGSQLTSELLEYSSGGLDSNPRVPQRYANGLIRQILTQHSGREDMQQERGQANFNIRELTYYMDGGEAATKVIDRVVWAVNELG